jgi:hypothetical protein
LLIAGSQKEILKKKKKPFGKNKIKTSLNAKE